MDGSQTKTDGSTPASRGRTGGVEPATNCATRQRAARLYFVRGCSAAVAVTAPSRGFPMFSRRRKRRRKRTSEQSQETRRDRAARAENHTETGGKNLELEVVNSRAALCVPRAK